MPLIRTLLPALVSALVIAWPDPATARVAGARQDAGSDPATGSAQAPEWFWQKDLAQAFATSTEERRPLMVLLLPEAVESPEEYLKELREHEGFAPLAERFLYAVGSAASHAETRVEVAGLERLICEAFGNLSCAEHQGLLADAQALLPEARALPLPQTAWFDPDHNLIYWRTGALSAETTVGLLKNVLRASAIDPETGEALEHTPDSDRAWFALQMEQVRRETTIYDKSRLLGAVTSRPSATLRELVLDQVRRGGDPQLRAGLVERLAVPGEVTLLEPFLEALKDKDERASLAAVDGLRVLGLAPAAEALLPLLKVHRRGQEHGRVVLALASCGGGDEDVRDKVLKEARQADDGLRCYGLMAVGYLPPDEETRKQLRRGLKDRVTRVRAAALWAAGRCRDPELAGDVEQLLVRERTDDLREVAAQALQRIQDPTLEAGPGAEAAWDSIIEDHVPLAPPWS